MKPTGYYDSTTPRAFTDRQREIDPLLVREDTNSLFEAFQRRSKLHRIRFLDRFLPAGKSSHEGDMESVLMIHGILIVEALLTCGIAFPILFQAMKSVNMRARITSDRLPSRLMLVFSSKGFVNSVAIDLVQAGVRGSEILEAMYLESRIDNFSAAKYAYVLITSLVLIVSLFVMLPLSPAESILFASLVFAAWRLWYPFIDGTIMGTARSVMLSRLVQWSAANPYNGVIEYALSIAPHILRKIILYVVAFIVIIMSTDKMYFVNWSRLPLIPSPMFVRPAFELFAALMLVLASIRTFFGRKKRVAAMKEKIEFYLSLADVAFEHFTLTRVLNDPDAKALALERNLGITVIERLKKDEWKRFWKRY